MAKAYLPAENTNYSIYPYASYHSNVANRAKRIVTMGRDCLLGGEDSFQIVPVSVGPLAYQSVKIQPGKCVIDDVLIELDTEITVDLTSDDNFKSPGGMVTENGYYYICIEYRYAKMKPPPKAYIQTLKPSERGSYIDNGRYLILGVLYVNSGVLVSPYVYISDPENPDNKRRYPPSYAEIYDVLPNFNAPDDMGKIICLVPPPDSTDYGRVSYYFGFANNWGLLATSSDSTGEGGDIINIGVTVETHDYAPTSSDWNFPNGTFWLYTNADSSKNTLYVLVDNTTMAARWHIVTLTAAGTTNPTYSTTFNPNGGFYVNTDTGELFFYAYTSVSTNPEYTTAFNWSKIKRTIVTNITLYLDPTDGDDLNSFPTSATPFKTTTRMNEFLEGFNIASGVEVTIKIVEGVHSITEAIDIRHTDGERINLVGGSTAVNKTFSTAENLGGSGPYNVRLTLNSLSLGDAIANESYALIYGATSVNPYVVNPYMLNGSYLITDVDVPGARITIQWDGILDNGKNPAPVPDNAVEDISGSVSIIKTVLKCNGCDGIVVYGDNKLNNVHSLEIVGESDVSEKTGIGIPPTWWVDNIDGGSISLLERVGIRSMGLGLNTTIKTKLVANYITINSCEWGADIYSGNFAHLYTSYNNSVGTYISGGSIWISYFASVGNSSAGIYSSNGSATLSNCILTSNADAGISANGGSSSINFSGSNYTQSCKCFNNKGSGFYAEQGATIIASRSLSFWNDDNGYFANTNSTIICYYSRSIGNTNCGYVALQCGTVIADSLTYDQKASIPLEGEAVIEFDPIYVDDTTSFARHSVADVLLTALPEGLSECYGNGSDNTIYCWGGTIYCQKMIIEANNTTSNGIMVGGGGVVYAIESIIYRRVAPTASCGNGIVIYDGSKVYSTSSLFFYFLNGVSVGTAGAYIESYNSISCENYENGFFAESGGVIQAWDSHAFNNETGYYASVNATIDIQGATTMNKNYSTENYTQNHATFMADTSAAIVASAVGGKVGNTGIGLLAENGGVIKATLATIVGNGDRGCEASSTSIIAGYRMKIVGNADIGLHAYMKGTIHALECLILDNGPEGARGYDDASLFLYNCHINTHDWYGVAVYRRSFADVSSCEINNAPWAGLYASHSSYLDSNSNTFPVGVTTQHNPSTWPTSGNYGSYIEL